MRRAGREVERPLVREEEHRVGVGGPVRLVDAVEREQRFEVADPARVMKQVPQRDLRPVVRELREVFPDVVVEAHLPVDDQKRERRSEVNCLAREAM